MKQKHLMQKESRKFQEISFHTVSYVLSSFSTEEKCGKQKQDYVVMELEHIFL